MERFSESDCAACGLPVPVDLMPDGDLVRYADAQATVEALQRERDLYKRSADTFAECVDNVREAMGLESTHYLVLPDDVGDMRKERDQLKTALDAEREKVKGLEALQVGFDGQDEVLDIKKSDYYALRYELSQLQALVRALPMAVDVYTHKEGRVILAALQSGVNEMIVCYTDDTAKPIAALLTYRATLAATTPARRNDESSVDE